MVGHGAQQASEVTLGGQTGLGVEAPRIAPGLHQWKACQPYQGWMLYQVSAQGSHGSKLVIHLHQTSYAESGIGHGRQGLSKSQVSFWEAAPGQSAQQIQVAHGHRRLTHKIRQPLRILGEMV